MSQVRELLPNGKPGRIVDDKVHLTRQQKKDISYAIRKGLIYVGADGTIKIRE